MVPITPSPDIHTGQVLALDMVRGTQGHLIIVTVALITPILALGATITPLVSSNTLSPVGALELGGTGAGQLRGPIVRVSRGHTPNLISLVLTIMHSVAPVCGLYTLAIIAAELVSIAG